MQSKLQDSHALTSSTYNYSKPSVVTHFPENLKWFDVDAPTLTLSYKDGESHQKLRAINLDTSSHFRNVEKKHR